MALPPRNYIPSLNVDTSQTYIEKNSLPNNSWVGALMSEKGYTFDPGTNLYVKNEALGRYMPDNSTFIPLQMAGGDHAASDTTARLLRSQYDDWITTYFPKVDDLIQQTTYGNPDLMPKELDASQQQVDTAFNVAHANQAYQVGKYGMDQTSEARQGQQVSAGMAQATAEVDAANRTRQRLADRNQKIALGGLPSAVAGGA